VGTKFGNDKVSTRNFSIGLDAPWSIQPWPPATRVPAFFALHPFVFADLFLGQICDPVEGIRMHHRRGRPRAPRFPKFGAWGFRRCPSRPAQETFSRLPDRSARGSSPLFDASVPRTHDLQITNRALSTNASGRLIFDRQQPLFRVASHGTRLS